MKKIKVALEYLPISTKLRLLSAKLMLKECGRNVDTGRSILFSRIAIMVKGI